MKGKPKPFLRNSEIDELCERLIYEYMGDDGAGKPVDIILCGKKATTLLLPSKSCEITERNSNIISVIRMNL